MRAGTNFCSRRNILYYITISGMNDGKRENDVELHPAVSLVFGQAEVSIALLSSTASHNLVQQTKGVGDHGMAISKETVVETRLSSMHLDEQYCTTHVEQRCTSTANMIAPLGDTSMYSVMEYNDPEEVVDIVRLEQRVTQSPPRVKPANSINEQRLKDIIHTGVSPTPHTNAIRPTTAVKKNVVFICCLVMFVCRSIIN